MAKLPWNVVTFFNAINRLFIPNYPYTFDEKVLL